MSIAFLIHKQRNREPASSFKSGIVDLWELIICLKLIEARD